MKISYSILTHNETDSLEKLLRFLVKWKQEEDEKLKWRLFAQSDPSTEVVVPHFSDAFKTIHLI